MASANIYIRLLAAFLALSNTALAEWRHLQQGYRQAADAGALVRGLSALLRRAAISSHPRQEVAALVGMRWLLFLDQGVEGNGFSRGVGRALVSAPYRPEPEVNAEALLELSRQWLKRLPHGGRQ